MWLILLLNLFRTIAKAYSICFPFISFSKKWHSSFLSWAVSMAFLFSWWGIGCCLLKISTAKCTSPSEKCRKATKYCWKIGRVDKACYPIKTPKTPWVEKEEPKMVERIWYAGHLWLLKSRHKTRNLYKTCYNTRIAAACNQHNKAGLGIQSYTMKIHCKTITKKWQIFANFLHNLIQCWKKISS